MITPDDMITALAGKYQHKIAKLIKPLNSLGISYFCWQQVTNAGGWRLIGNHPEWLLHSARNQFYLYDPTLIDPRQYDSGFCYTKAHQHDECQKTLIKDSLELFNIDHGFAIVERTVNGAEFTFLAGHPNDLRILNTYVNSGHYLKKFVSYFKNEIKSLMPLMQEAEVNIASLKAQSFYAEDNILDLGVGEKNKSLLPLTPREQDCLELLFRGKTAKETAMLLGISARTVETHLNNVRARYGLKSKRELITLFYP